MKTNVPAYIGTMKKELLRLKAAFDYYQTPFMWDQFLPVAV